MWAVDWKGLGQVKMHEIIKSQGFFGYIFSHQSDRVLSYLLAHVQQQ